MVLTSTAHAHAGAKQATASVATLIKETEAYLFRKRMGLSIRGTAPAFLPAREA